MTEPDAPGSFEALPLPPPPPSTPDDCRIYIRLFDSWKARVRTDWDRFYCFGKNPGEDYHHLILAGEIYVEGNDEVYCLRCALRLGIVTTDRLFWQRGPRQTPPMPM